MAIKLRIDIVEDKRFAEFGVGKRYKVKKWVFEKKTGRTIDHVAFCAGYSYKEARALKEKIKSDYFV